ncbi:chromosome segregation SMC family protein [Turneriella parva]|uniref:Chromosome partition protein Smc n=1 Tax=Turneriella parva (strain ATCC BAA-1111 / DSM 21527 / NCTC 11395 / H) TaxID=869212 RepID=I4B2U7_TURPD|nr:AAA family ATPase [Turneriella parva]AFM11604.1 condensin subunit Smc [Turneriella parva DSM 21527]
MLLKELEILGFKSFADKIKVSFSTSVSAVVGPNGCGKSNILDSLKWVLGEKSVKTMRGEKMEDVIFAGTSTRKPANFAQVSLTFDNRLRLLKIDTDDVKVGRRLYRDGQSQYFINDSRVALKEIEDLFRDTGIGKSSYSFMEQGRMDQILSSKPEDRRLIFEEAAGVSRFKAQREEAEKNLENTQLNLTRIQDIQRELERELKIKEAQAKKTAEYNSLMAKYKDHDLKIRYLMVRDSNDKLEDLKEKLSRRHGEKEKIQQKLIQMQERLAALDEDERTLKEELHKKDTSSQMANLQIAQLGQKIEEKETQKASFSSQLAGLKERIGKFEKRIKELKAEAAEQNQFTLKLDLKVSDIQKEIARLQKRIDECAEESAAADADLLRLEAEKAEATKKLNEVHARQEETIRELLDSLKAEKSRWEKTAKNREQAFTEIELYCNETSASLEAILAAPDDHLPQMRKDLQRVKDSRIFEKISEKAHLLAEMSRGLYEILFEKGGVHSRKEELDEEITALEKQIDLTTKESARLTARKLQLADETSANKQEREKLLGDIKSLNVEITSVKEKEKNLAGQIANEESNMGFVRAQFTEIDRSVVQLAQEQKNLTREVEKLKSSIEKETQRIAGIERDIQKAEEKRRELVQTMKNESGKTDEVFTAINELEGKIGALGGSRDILLQNIYNDYTLTWQELSAQFTSGKMQLADEKEKLTELQRGISALGQINQLAIEEHRHIKEMYDHQQTQVDDILRAQEDIKKVMAEIQAKSETLFRESFEQINHNFAEIFGKLFNGGQAKLDLLEPDRPLASGIEIEATPPGKKTKSMRLMSGGEKAMTAIALMFAIYMVRSSPFCVLDEIDAPLDEQNVGRFLTLLDEFARNTQFILITHNKKTMGKAQVLYGVTMNEPGVSTLLSVELSKAVVG